MRAPRLVGRGSPIQFHDPASGRPTLWSSRKHQLNSMIELRFEGINAQPGVRRGIYIGAIGTVVLGVLIVGSSVVQALTADNLGTGSITLDKTPFDDVTIPPNSGLLVTPQTVQTIAAGSAAVGDTSPGVEATTAKPSVNNALTADNLSYRFQVQEHQPDGFQAGYEFLVEVSEDASLVASLFLKQDTVDDLNVEGVTVEVDIGATAGAMSTIIKRGQSPATLTVVDGYDEQSAATLIDGGSLFLVQTSDNDWLQQDTPFYVSYQFSNVTIPAGATITSVAILVEHWEAGGFSGPLLWKVGTGWPSSPTEWGNTTPPINKPKNAEATDSWDVTSLVNTPARVNDMELVIQNSDSGKTSNQDYIYAVVEWYE